MKFKMKILMAVLVLAGGAAAMAAANPLEFPSYEQLVEVEFATPEAAAAAVCEIAPLPGDASVAFSCRWDDSNPAHIAKGEMMNRAGVKGNFYFCGPGNAFTATGPKKLMTMGHAIGNHTVNHPSMMTLSLNCDNRCNTYNIYVYSDDDKSWENIRYATELNDSVKALLENGETVIFSPKHADIENVSVGGMFTPDYWNYAMFKNISQIVNKPVSPGTLGYLIDDKNATLTNTFPTQFHSDWQWWTIAKNTRPIIIDGTAITPDVMAIDNIDRAHKLGVLFSLSIGNGHLVVCMTDLKAITDKPEGRQYIRMIGQYAKEKKNTTEMNWEDAVELFNRTISEEEIAGIDNISDYSEKR